MYYLQLNYVLWKDKTTGIHPIISQNHIYMYIYYLYRYTGMYVIHKYNKSKQILSHWTSFELGIKCTFLTPLNKIFILFN